MILNHRICIRIYISLLSSIASFVISKQTDTTKYYDTTNIQEVIIEKFGIKIPLIVIKQSLKITSNEHPDFEIKLLTKVNQLSIKKIWDVAISDSIERIYEQNLEHFTALQNAFMRYIEVEQLQNRYKLYRLFRTIPRTYIITSTMIRRLNLLSMKIIYTYRKFS